MRPSGLHWQQRYHPFTGRISGVCVLFTSKFYCNLFSGCSPAPYLQFSIALQHHAVAYQPWQPHLAVQWNGDETCKQYCGKDIKFCFHNNMRRLSLLLYNALCPAGRYHESCLSFTFLHVVAGYNCQYHCPHCSPVLSLK